MKEQRIAELEVAFTIFARAPLLRFTVLLAVMGEQCE
jgi:hypothetical protein